jgi:predicted esterase
VTRALRVGLLVAISAGIVGACRRTPTTSTAGAPSSAIVVTTAPTAAESVDAAANADAGASASVDAAAASADAAAELRAIGPYELPFDGKRNVFFVVPPSRVKGQRLITNLHGMCNPPGYACGYWTNAASQKGFLVCPTGNSTCGAAMYNAPTWTESFAKMDEDLEKAIATVDAAYPGEISRDGAILTGFSRGAFAAPEIAKMHPGRWPYLILNEANVPLNAATLRKSGVRAVAMIAGERGGEIHGERVTVASLGIQKFPAKLWVMPGAGHYYSANIDDIMREAIEWLLAQPIDGADGG